MCRVEYICCFFCRAMLCRHAVSVTFVNCVETSNRIVRLFSQSSSQVILVFSTKRDGNIPTGTPLTGASNAGWVGRNREPIAAWLHGVL